MAVNPGGRTDYRVRGFAERYAAARPLSPAVQAVWVDAIRTVRPPSTEVCVDLGCGTGRFWNVLRRALAPVELLAVDRSAEMLMRGADNTARRLIADLDHLPLQRRSVDLVWLSMALQYSVDRPALLRELHRVLRGGGMLLIRTADERTLRSFPFLRHFPTAAAAERRAFHSLHPGRDLEQELAEAGFCGIRRSYVIQPVDVSWVTYVARVARRGFPSLQLAPTREFRRGLAGLAVHGLCAALRRRPVPSEECLLVSAEAP